MGVSNIKPPKPVEKFICRVNQEALCTNYVGSGSGKGVFATVICSCADNRDAVHGSPEVFVAMAKKCLDKKRKAATEAATEEIEPPT